jgi:hypothetical protein
VRHDVVDAVAQRFAPRGRSFHDAFELLRDPSVAGHRFDGRDRHARRLESFARLDKPSVDLGHGMRQNVTLEISARVQEHALHEVTRQRCVAVASLGQKLFEPRDLGLKRLGHRTRPDLRCQCVAR